MGKTCESPGAANAEGNHRRSSRWLRGFEGKCKSRTRCSRQVSTKLLTCRRERHTTGDRFCRPRKVSQAHPGEIVNHAAIYSLPTARSYWGSRARVPSAEDMRDACSLAKLISNKVDDSLIEEEYSWDNIDMANVYFWDIVEDSWESSLFIIR